MKYMKTSLIILIVTILSIVLGFARESIVVAKLGVTWQADSFNFVVLLPGFIFSTIGGVISTTFLPIYTDIKIKKSLKEANIFASVFTNYIVIICFILICLGEIFPDKIVKFLAPGFLGQTFNLTVDLVRLVVPSLFFMGITYCLIGVLQSNKDFIIASAITIPIHLSIIIALVLIYPKYGFNNTIIFVVLGSVIQVLLTIKQVKKFEYNYYLKMKCDNEYIKKALKMIAPMIIGIMALQINIMIDRMLASTLEAGTITAINLSSKLNIASYSSIGYIIVMMIFPILSECKSRDDFEGYGKVLNKGINIMAILMIPITIFIIFFSKEIVDVLFGYGKFNKNDIKYIAEILVWYSLGIFFLAIRDLLNRGFYSLQDTITPMKNSLIAIFLNIVLNIVLIKIFKAKGIAISTTIAMIICSILLLLSIKNIIKSLSLKVIGINLLKIFLSAVLFFVTMLEVQNILNLIGVNKSSKIQIVIYMSIITFIGIIVYVITLFIFRVDGVVEIKQNILKKLNKIMGV